AGKTVVVAYRPKVVSGAKPVSFASPAQRLLMDKVELLTDVEVAVTRNPGGYQVIATIPKATVGLPEGARGVERCGLDVSINFSDPAGQRNVARIHWGRNGATLVYDLPSEARLEPETWGVGVLK
ncbi:MAG: hypothetical protein WCI73_17225, partial [Phycisphaerae bacterium]